MADLERMQVISSNIDDIRNLTNCKICLKPYYEPYILACGHTYCYSCLRSWFGGLDQRRKKKNCPDCRAEVITQPAPNYLLRDLVHIFIGRAELLPEDESLEEHARGKHDEARQLSNDRKAGGLFQGIFPSQTAPHHRPGPIRDLDDNVFRCPLCAFELEEDGCNNCGWYPPPDSGSYLSEESVEGLFSDGEQSTATNEDTRRHSQFFGPQWESEDSEGEDDHYGTPQDYGIDLDHYDEEDDFIDNGEIEEDHPDEVDYADTADGNESHTEYSTDGDDDIPLGNRRYHNAGEMTTQQPRGGIHNWVSPELTESDNGTNYDESENDVPSPLPIISPATAPSRPVARRGRQTVVISDEDDEDDEEDQDQSPRPVPRRSARQMAQLPYEDDDEEESANSDSDMSDEDESEANNSEDSEDTAIPPQTRAQRQQRLVNHRSRRPPQAQPTLSHVRNPASDSETRRRVWEARQHMANTMAAGRRTARTASTYVH